MLQCGFVRSNFAFAILRLSLPKNRHKLKTSLLSNHLSEPTSSAAGAGDGNRTHVASLEGWWSTIELHPPGTPPLPPALPNYTRHSARSGRRAAPGGGGRIRTYVDIRRQIYSLLPLTARPPLRKPVSKGAAETAS